MSPSALLTVGASQATGGVFIAGGAIKEMISLCVLHPAVISLVQANGGAGGAIKEMISLCVLHPAAISVVPVKGGSLAVRSNR